MIGYRGTGRSETILVYPRIPIGPTPQLGRSTLLSSPNSMREGSRRVLKCVVRYPYAKVGSCVFSR